MARGKCLLRNSISESIQTSLLLVENCLLNSLSSKAAMQCNLGSKRFENGYSKEPLH